VARDYASLRGVVFDAVGTLIYPDPPVAITYYELGRQHGSQLSQSDIARNFRRVLKCRTYERRTNEQIERGRWRLIVADVFTDLDDTQSLFRHLWDHFARSTSWAVYDDVPDVLAELNSRGLITAIGSNFDDRLLSIAKQLAPLDQLDAIFVSAQLGYTKPSIEFFRSIEHRLQLRPSQLLMVGDDIRNDFEGGATAGWRSLLLNRETSMDGDASLRSLLDLIQLLPTK